MDASHLRPEGFADDAAYRSRLAEIDPNAPPQDFLEPKDYVLTERAAMTALRDELNDVQFQIEVLNARLSAITLETSRLAKSTVNWADASAHEQLGAYPWAKLAAAFSATFLVTGILRKLPLAALTSIAVPMVLRQVRR